MDKLIPKMTLYLFVILALLTCLSFPVPGTGISQEDVLLAADVPLYPGAVDITRSIDPFNKIKTVTYWVGESYPAPELLEYYDTQLTSREWIPNFETCQRQWYGEPGVQKSIDAAVDTLYASWRHPETNMTFSLWLNHYPQNALPKREIWVKYQIGWNPID